MCYYRILNSIPCGIPLVLGFIYFKYSSVYTPIQNSPSTPFPHTSVQFSCSVVSDSLRPHESQHAKPPCPSPTPGVHPHPCPLSQWCHLTISSSVVPFSCPQSFPASGSFPLSQFFASGGELQCQHQSFQWIFRIDFL